MAPHQPMDRPTMSSSRPYAQAATQPAPSPALSTSQSTNPQTSPQPSSAPGQISPQKANLDLGIVLLLHKWPALTTAVSSLWGGPDSADKRDWFAGFLSDYLASEPLADAEDVETMLLDFLEGEFDTRVEDESEVGLALEVIALRRGIMDGDLRKLDELRSWWEARAARQEAKISRGSLPATAALVGDQGEREEEWSEDEEGGVSVVGEGDVEMGDAEEAPALVPRKEKAVPEVDEDGFTTVVSKRRR